MARVIISTLEVASVNIGDGGGGGGGGGGTSTVVGGCLPAFLKRLHCTRQIRNTK